MIGKKDIDNVRTIMYKAKNLAKDYQEEKKFEELIRGFNDAAMRYLKEVRNNAKLQ